MATHSVNNMKKEISPEVELLNLACLDLVAQIERLEKENARLRQKAREGDSSGRRGSELSDSAR
jgi:hypothetical protein